MGKRYQCISREMLKVLAMFFMLLDHAYMTVVNVPGFEWMTQVGRLAFPIFAFQITEGYIHTSNKKKYMKTMFVFALISEIPYNLMMGGEIIGPFTQNVMFTFLIALLLLTVIDKVLGWKKNWFLKGIVIAGICVLSVIVGTLTFVDYSGFGVLTVLTFYLAGKLPKGYLKMLAQLAGLWVINWIFLGGKVIIFSNGFEFPEQGIAVFSLIFIWLYNGRKSLKGTVDHVFKYVSYWFYPVHIFILSLLALYVL